VKSTAFVPESIRIEAIDPLTWPRIEIASDQLDVPGVGLVRIVHGAHVLAWHLLDDCASRVDCIAMVVGGDHARCFRTGQSRWDRFGADIRALDLPPCVCGIEIAAAVHIAGQLAHLVVHGGVPATLDVLGVPGQPDADAVRTLAIRDSTLRVEYDDVSPSSARVHWLRRNLEFPAGWERYPDRAANSLRLAEERMRARYPNSLDECDDGPWEGDLCTDCGRLRESGSCGDCAWP
jgi:hypothetical protein